MSLCCARIPCHQKFLAHFEKFRADPRSFTAPLKSFLSLEERGGKLLEESIDSVAKQKKSLPMLKLPRQLVPMCSSRDSDKKCNKEVSCSLCREYFCNNTVGA